MEHTFIPSTVSLLNQRQQTSVLSVTEQGVHKSDFVDNILSFRKSHSRENIFVKEVDQLSGKSYHIRYYMLLLLDEALVTDSFLI